MTERDHEVDLAGYYPSAWPAECAGPRRQKVTRASGLRIQPGERLRATSRSYPGRLPVMFVRRGSSWIERTLATHDHDPGSALESMETATGLSQAAFATLALRDTETRAGCLLPDQWVALDEFLPLLGSLGSRRDARLLGSVKQREFRSLEALDAASRSEGSPCSERIG
ncbi:MAG: hypothetical protein QNK05_19410 [Myxococcota bacterium]|nr:hypothetical protein [Myxococcota bacterium]